MYDEKFSVLIVSFLGKCVATIENFHDKCSSLLHSMYLIQKSYNNNDDYHYYGGEKCSVSIETHDKNRKFFKPQQ